VPFLSASLRTHASEQYSPYFLALLLTLASGLIGGLSAWAGLKLADRAALPMPLLRNWESGTLTAPPIWIRLLSVSMLAGLMAGGGIALLVHALPIPRNPGSLSARCLSLFFAATVTEVLTHLFAMSGFQVLFRRTWLSILLSSFVFVAIFHAGQVGGPAVTLFVLAANFLFATLTGWLYSRYGFEAAMFTHAIGHLIVVGVG